MPRALTFAEAIPGEAAASLDAGSVHLWRIAHAREQRRAPLRQLLAPYLQLPAAAVELVEDARGKPALAPGLQPADDARRLAFNWSHSGDYALVALARGVEPGVDIERHHVRENALALARRFFDREEVAALARHAGTARDHAFLSLWCAKEAVLKATGEGLSFGLARLAFSPEGTGWRLAALDAALGAAADWQLAGFEAAPGYHGALAWRGGARAIVPLRPAGD